MRLGEKYLFTRFKKPSVGRKKIGEVVRKAGAITYFKTRTGEVVPVQTRHIHNLYVYVPYKKRSAA